MTEHSPAWIVESGRALYGTRFGAKLGRALDVTPKTIYRWLAPEGSVYSTAPPKMAYLAIAHLLSTELKP